MLKEVTHSDYFSIFTNQHHPFLSKDFIELNQNKVERVIYLLQDNTKPSIGLILGLKDNYIMSPFSAPFGGFHFRHENIYIGEIEIFIKDLKSYIILNKFKKFEITFAPSIYGSTFNSKIINALARNQFEIEVPSLTNWVDLAEFNDRFSQRNSREYYNQAIRNELFFKELIIENDKKAAYELVKDNRMRFGRSIYMTFSDIIDTGKLWPLDFFGVYNNSNELIAAAIFYQFSSNIAYAVFWGDTENGRPLRAMDYMSFNLWSFYRQKGFSFIDLGVSTENNSVPNEGLLRFKETHEAKTELKFKITLKNT